MRRISLTIVVLCILSVLVPLASQPGAGLQATGPELISYFPRNGASIQPDTKISLVFSELMDALSVNNSLTVKTEAGVTVEMKLSGECGDATTIVFSPASGSWSGGNYTLWLNRTVTARGFAFNVSLGPIGFEVKDDAPVTVDASVIGADGVVVPVMPSGMIQRDRLAADRVHCVHADVLAVIAALARQSEVAGFVSAASGAGHDVFDRERVGRETRLTATVFTTLPCPVDDGSPGSCRDAGLTHTRRA